MDLRRRANRLAAGRDGEGSPCSEPATAAAGRAKGVSVASPHPRTEEQRSILILGLSGVGGVNGVNFSRYAGRVQVIYPFAGSGVNDPADPVDPGGWDGRAQKNDCPATMPPGTLLAVRALPVAPRETIPLEVGEGFARRFERGL